MWTIDLRFAEDADHTEAIATLRTPDGRELRGLGQSRRSSDDRPVMEIGEEVAGARALSSLAHRVRRDSGRTQEPARAYELLNYAASQIEWNVRRDDPVV